MNIECTSASIECPVSVPAIADRDTGFIIVWQGSSEEFLDGDMEEESEEEFEEAAEEAAEEADTEASEETLEEAALLVLVKHRKRGGKEGEKSGGM